MRPHDGAFAYPQFLNRGAYQPRQVHPCRPADPVNGHGRGALFPSWAQEIRRLCLRDPVFRDLCEDLEEAHSSLLRIVIFFGQGERTEFEEDQTVIAVRAKADT